MWPLLGAAALNLQCESGGRGIDGAMMCGSNRLAALCNLHRLAFGPCCRWRQSPLQGARWQAHGCADLHVLQQCVWRKLHLIRLRCLQIPSRGTCMAVLTVLTPVTSSLCCWSFTQRQCLDHKCCSIQCAGTMKHFVPPGQEQFNHPCHTCQTDSSCTVFCALSVLTCLSLNNWQL